MFDKAVIQNNFRGAYVECMIAELLGDDWKQTADWAGWDFCHTDGTRLEVKQSAMQQSWDEGDVDVKRPRRFSIRKPAGYYDGLEWVEATRRPAQIYIFAWHETHGSNADQREPQQWQFFVANEAKLPVQSSISVSRVRALSKPVACKGLRAEVEALRQQGVLQ